MKRKKREEEKIERGEEIQSLTCSQCDWKVEKDNNRKTITDLKQALASH